jgi:hypothetical protein
MPRRLRRGSSPSRERKRPRTRGERTWVKLRFKQEMIDVADNLTRRQDFRIALRLDAEGARRGGGSGDRP